jgi:hypothetical protein
MAIQENNFVMHNARGMFGGQVVFKKRAGKRFVAAPPNVKHNRKPTPNQLVAQERFKRAVEYSVQADAIPELRNAYKKLASRGQSARNVAYKDAYYPPEVLGIITQAYAGMAGNVIVVTARDNYKVDAVKVAIYNSSNELIEEGDAVVNPDGITWNYTVTQYNSNVAGCRIKATAYDIPGNEGVMEVVV